MNSLEGLALMRLHEVLRHWDRPSMDDWTEVLANFSLFSGVSKRRLPKLVRDARFAEVAAGQTILSNGDAPLAQQHPAITLTMLRNLSAQLRRLEAQVAR